MKKLLKWLAIGAGVIVLLIIIAGVTTVVMSNKALAKTYEVTVPPVTIPTDSASILRGRHIAIAIAKCGDCHGADYAGTMFINDPGFGQIAAPNITPGRGSVTDSYTDLDWVRTIRHGVKPDGRGTIVMPSEAYRYLSDADLGAVIAYMKSLPAADSTWPAPALGPVARPLIAFNVIPVFSAAYIDQSRGDVPAAPPADTTAAYGDYLTQIGGCRGCHNPALSGGPTGEPGAPPASNLTPAGIGHWTADDFRLALREGKRPNTDLLISEKYMPWRSSGKMTDAEIYAVYLYLKSIPSREMGQR